jgi:dihydroneopterin aldolase/2-amino-4-hydroxy-6-hydroxymethyldihydropteridine diphosphokinase
VMTSAPVNLVETLAEQVAAATLAFPGVKAVDVVVHKPSAALPMPFEDVSVAIRRDPTVRPPVVGAPGLSAPGLNTASLGASGLGAPGIRTLTSTVPEPIADALADAPQQPVAAVLALGSNLGDSKLHSCN